MPIEPSSALADVDLFTGLSEGILSELEERGETMTFESGEEIVAQGSSNADLHVILSGLARVEINGVERAVLGEHDYFGEISVIAPAPRSATIVAGEDGLTSFVLTQSRFAPMLQNLEFLQGLTVALCSRLRDLEFHDVTWSFRGIRPPAHGQAAPNESTESP